MKTFPDQFFHLIVFEGDCGGFSYYEATEALLALPDLIDAIDQTFNWSVVIPGEYLWQGTLTTWEDGEWDRMPRPLPSDWCWPPLRRGENRYLLQYLNGTLTKP